MVIQRTDGPQVLHGALFFPHTRSLEETSKMTLDWYYDALDEGLEPVSPHIFRIPKGTKLSQLYHPHGLTTLISQRYRYRIRLFSSTTITAGSLYNL